MIQAEEFNPKGWCGDMPELSALDDFRKEPWRLVELALAVAKDGFKPPEALELELKNLEEPPIRDLASASAPLWELLMLPERVEGLRWLDKVGLLSNLFPCWGGNPARKKMRLDAVMAVHLETWKAGLSDKVVQLILDTHNVVIEGRLNGWALTALATLLAGGDTENQYFWAKMVRRNMFELSATETEIVWVESIVFEYRKAIHFLRGEVDEATMTPQIAVVLLSTMAVAKEDTKTQVMQAALRLDNALKDYSV